MLLAPSTTCASRRPLRTLAGGSSRQHDERDRCSSLRRPSRLSSRCSSEPDPDSTPSPWARGIEGTAVIRSLRIDGSPQPPLHGSSVDELTSRPSNNRRKARSDPRLSACRLWPSKLGALNGPYQ